MTCTCIPRTRIWIPAACEWKAWTHRFPWLARQDPRSPGQLEATRNLSAGSAGRCPARMWQCRTPSHNTPASSRLTPPRMTLSTASPHVVSTYPSSTETCEPSGLSIWQPDSNRLLPHLHHTYHPSLLLTQTSPSFSLSLSLTQNPLSATTFSLSLPLSFLDLQQQPPARNPRAPDPAPQRHLCMLPAWNCWSPHANYLSARVFWRCRESLRCGCVCAKASRRLRSLQECEE